MPKLLLKSYLAIYQPFEQTIYKSIFLFWVFFPQLCGNLSTNKKATIRMDSDSSFYILTIPFKKNGSFFNRLWEQEIIIKTIGR